MVCEECEACHPGPSILNFGRVRFPRLGCQFGPLTQMYTQEGVPTTAVAAADDIDPARVRAVETDTEEDRPNSPRSSLIDDLQCEMRVGSGGEPAILGPGDVYPTVLDAGGERDRESATIENVQFEQEVVSDLDIFREDLGVEGPDVPLPRLPRSLSVNGLQSMDRVDIRHVFHRRPLVMKSVPRFMQGAFRGGLRALMEEISAARLARDVLRQNRAWKAFLLLPRLLLHKPPRGGAQASVRSTTSLATVQKRAARALQLVQMGELSSSRQVLEGAEQAPGTLATLAALSDPERRPPEPRDLLPPELIHHRPQVELDLSPEGGCARISEHPDGAQRQDRQE